MSTAQPIVQAFIATTGHGKTTAAKKEAQKLKGDGTILVIVDDEMVQGWDDVKAIAPTKKALSFKKGIRKIYFDDYGIEVWEAIKNYYRNGVIILDDAVNFVKQNMEHNGKLRKVITGHRHTSCDIIYIVHQFNDIPPKMWGYCKFINIGKLTSLPLSSEIKSADPKRLIETAKYVNQEIAKVEATGGSAWGQFYCFKNS